MPIKLGEITLYSVQELSKRLNVTPITLRSYLKSGRIRGQKVAGKWYVAETSLRRFFEGEPGEGKRSRG